MKPYEVMAYIVYQEPRNVVCKGYIMPCPEHPTYTFVVHKLPERSVWRVTEALTGRAVAGLRDTRKEAVAAAQEKLSTLTAEYLSAAIARHLLGDAE